MQLIGPTDPTSPLPSRFSAALEIDAAAPPPLAERGSSRLWLDGERPLEAAAAARLIERLERGDPAALESLDGGFVGVLARPGEILLFRDAIGLRALHFTRQRDALLLDRDPLPLAQAAGPPRIDETWLARYFLTLPEDGPRTPFAGVERVEPGHLTRITPTAVTSTRWWCPSFAPLDLGFEEALAQATRLLDRAIDPATGGNLFLSSGIDSNVILSRLVADGRAPRAITASPSAHADPSTVQVVDEYPLAHAALRSMGGGEHHRLRAAPSGLRDAVNWGFAAYQRPIYNPSNLGWVHGCYALASDLGMERIFDGLYGNYTLGHNGVRRTVALAAAGRWREWAMRVAAQGGRDLRASLLAAPPRWLARWLARPAARRHVAALFADPRSPAIAAALVPEVEAGVRLDRPDDGLPYPARRLREYVFQLDPAPRLRATEKRHGLTLVDPYADRAVVEFSLRLPEHLFRHEGRARGLQRALLDDRLPPAIRNPQLTAIQGADWRAAALRDAGLMRQILERLEAGHPGAALFDHRAMRRALDHWPASGWDDEEQVARYRVHLGRAMTCAAFAQWVADGAA